MCYIRPRWFNYTLLEKLWSNKLCFSHRKQVISEKASLHIKKLPLLSYISHIFLQNNLISQIVKQSEYIYMLQNTNTFHQRKKLSVPTCCAATKIQN